MKLELKAIKHTEWASEETHCYTANLYKDGKPFAVVRNDGHGGPDYVDPHNKFSGTHKEFRKAVQDIESYFKALPPQETSLMNEDGTPWMCEQSLEGWCGDQVDDFLRAKDLKRNMGKGKYLFLVGGSEIQAWKGGSQDPEKTIRSILQKISDGGNQDAICLNQLPFDEALNLWRKYA